MKKTEKKAGFVIGIISGFILWMVINGYPYPILALGKDFAIPIAVFVGVIGAFMSVISGLKNSCVLGRPWKDGLIYGILAVFGVVYAMTAIYYFLVYGRWFLP